MERNNSITSETQMVDWDEFEDENGYGRRPSLGFGICSCLLSTLGMKSSSQALYDTRIKLQNLISLQKKRFNSAEFAFLNAGKELKECKKQKNLTMVRAIMLKRMKAKKKMECMQKNIDSNTDRLNSIDDLEDSKAAAEMLKEIGKNMQYFRIDKRVNDAQKAYEVIDDNRIDMQELQRTLAQPSSIMYDSNNVEITEEELEDELKAFFEEDVEEKEEVVVDQPSQRRTKFTAKSVERGEELLLT